MGKERTLVMYVVANNSLRSVAIDLLDKIKESDINTEKSNLLILIDVSGVPTLYKYTHTNKLELIKKFSGKEAINIDCVEAVLDFSLNYYPAKENGIVFWSHGSAWLPSGIEPNDLRSFGYSKGSECDIMLLSHILKIEYDYIIFDACLMGSVEVYSEFSEKTKYVIGSPKVVPASGILSVSSIDTLLCSDNHLIERLKTVCAIYSEQISLGDREVSLVSSYELFQFQQYLSKLIANYKNDTNYVEFEDKYIVRGKIFLYNIKEVLSTFFEKEQYPELYDMLHRMVKYSSRNSYENPSISIYIPENFIQQHLQYYKRLNWNKQTDWLTIFNQK